jgi:hypothetical protein
MLQRLLVGTRLFDRIVRSLSRPLVHGAPCPGAPLLSFLHVPFKPMLLAGHRSAGAGGGGPGL